MLVVVCFSDVDIFIVVCNKENIDVVVVVIIIVKLNFVMIWDGEIIVDLECCFFDINGVCVVVDVKVVDKDLIVLEVCIILVEIFEVDMFKVLFDFNYVS